MKQIRKFITKMQAHHTNFKGIILGVFPNLLYEINPSAEVKTYWKNTIKFPLFDDILQNEKIKIRFMP